VERRPHHHAAVAADLVVGVDVHHLVPAHLLEDLDVAVHPPRLVAADKELDLAAERVRRDEGRDEHVRVVVERVAREAARGQHERGGRAVHRALRRRAGGERLEGPLLDVGEREVVVLPAVRLGLPLPVQQVDVHRLGAPHDAHVAGRLAGVGAAARLVAHRLCCAAAGTVGRLRLDLLFLFLLCRAGEIPIKGQI
jgi:hypothetical protein